jgi:hypothetical protein
MIREWGADCSQTRYQRAFVDGLRFDTFSRYDQRFRSPIKGKNMFNKDFTQAS